MLDRLKVGVGVKYAGGSLVRRVQMFRQSNRFYIVGWNLGIIYQIAQHFFPDCIAVVLDVLKLLDMQHMNITVTIRLLLTVVESHNKHQHVRV